MKNKLIPGKMYYLNNKDYFWYVDGGHLYTLSTPRDLESCDNIIFLKHGQGRIPPASKVSFFLFKNKIIKRHIDNEELFLIDWDYYK